MLELVVLVLGIGLLVGLGCKSDETVVVEIYQQRIATEHQDVDPQVEFESGIEQGTDEETLLVNVLLHYQFVFHWYVV